MTAKITAALDQQPVEQEPVSWIENFEGSVSYGPIHEAARKLPEGVRFDLYTHPQPPRQPLTDEQISDLWIKHARSGAYIHAFVQAIERTHGIGGEA